MEGVEEEPGAAGVDVVVSDAGDDLAEGVLDGVSAGWFREFEGAAAGLTVVGVGDRFAGLVVVVAEFLAAHGWGTTALALGQDVAALVFAVSVVAVLDLLDQVCGFDHGLAPSVLFAQSLRNRGDGWVLPCLLVKCRGPTVGPGLFLSMFLF